VRLVLEDRLGLLAQTEQSDLPDRLGPRARMEQSGI
jgi:hypothetical protein